MHLFPMPTIFSFQKLKIDLEYFSRDDLHTARASRTDVHSIPPNNEKHRFRHVVFCLFTN